MRKTLQVRKYAAGYEVRKELVSGDEAGGGKDFIMKSAYTKEGDFIGNSLDAYRICKKRGIRPEKSDPSHCVCSIGFCEKEQKWYGWSHRAKCGFGIGAEIKDSDNLCSSSGWTEEYLLEHPDEDKSLPIGFVARTLDDCKKMAIAFAESVS